MTVYAGVPDSGDSSRPRGRAGAQATRRHATARAAVAGICGLAGAALIGAGHLGNGIQRNVPEGVSSRIVRDGQGPHLGRHLMRSDGEGTSRNSRRPRKRLAVVRPFGPDGAAEVSDSFDAWDSYWPCTSSASQSDDYGYDVDLFLSFSRKYDPVHYPESIQAMTALHQKFEYNRGWYGCFSNLYHIEASIPAHLDLYMRDHIQLNRYWVNGPNTQFRSIMDAVMLRNKDAAAGGGGGGGAEEEDKKKGVDGFGEYELVLILEPDARVRAVGWLDALLGDISAKKPFAMLGSKYKGHSWDSFKDQLPVSLLDHINGNAIYNISHPLVQNIVGELTAEADSLFNAIPFDYRISQMLTEGKLGIPPEFPFPEMRDPSGKWSVALPAKTDKFKSWWNDCGGEGKLNPIKESSVIANFAATNYLPEHLGAEPIVHGKGAFAPWDSRFHDISLVVTDWNEDFSRSILSNIDSSVHPFSEVLIVREPATSQPLARKSVWALLWEAITPAVSTKVPLRYHVREESSDYMDLCNAPVNTEWFMLTNAYHQVVPDVDLMFTHDDPPRPLIPYTPSSSKHCTDFAACRETLALAKDVYPELDKVILDLDMLYHTPSRNAFCAAWKEENGAAGEVLSMRVGGIEAYTKKNIPRGPTATSYVSYLYASGMAENIYAFTNRLDHGAKDAFIKVHGEAEAEHHPIANEAYWIHRSLTESGPNVFSRLWRKVFGVARKPAASERTIAPKHEVLTQQIEPAQETNSMAKPSFIRRFKNWWSKRRHSQSSEEGELDATLGAFASRAVKKADCAADGDQAKVCTDGLKGGIPQSCCTGFVCASDGSGRCVVLGSYGGGDVTRGLVLTAPGLLVHT